MGLVFDIGAMMRADIIQIFPFRYGNDPDEPRRDSSPQAAWKSAKNPDRTAYAVMAQPQVIP